MTLTMNYNLKRKEMTLNSGPQTTFIQDGCEGVVFKTSRKINH